MNSSLKGCWCGEARNTILFPSGVFQIVRCSACGQAYTQGVDQDLLTRSYDDKEFFVEQNDYLDPKAERHFTQLMRKISVFKNSGMVLDVGCSVGTLLDVAKAHGFNVAGVEVSKWASAYSREKGHNVVTGTLNDASFSDKSFDIIVLNHVIEHVPEPLDVLKEVSRILKDDGIVVVGVPNFGSYIAKIFQGSWISLHPGQHLWHFDHMSLSRLLKSAQLREVYFESSENHKVKGFRPVKILRRIINAIGRWSGNCEAMIAIAEKTLIS